jgi:four helix bundle protein
MKPITSYQQLIVWQKAFDLSIMVYHLTDLLPRSEQYGLCSQMRRSAVSVPSNIAEGYDRRSRKEYVSFLQIALGSSSELETQLLITQKVYNIEVQEALLLLIEVRKIIKTIIKKLLTPNP